MSDKKFHAVVKDLFIRCRKLKILIAFITQLYFSVPKNVKLNSTHYLIMKINNKKELQSIAIIHSTDNDYDDFVNIYREWTKGRYSFLTIDTTLSASDTLKFKKIVSFL